MYIFIIVLASAVAYIAAGSFVCQYMIARWELLDKYDDDYPFFKFAISLGLPITIFILIAYWVGDRATAASELHSRKNDLAVQKEKNALIKFRIQEKELLAAEQDLDIELSRKKV